MDTFKTLTDMRKSLPLYFANVMSAKCFRLIRLKQKIHCTHLAKKKKRAFNVNETCDVNS